MSQSVDQAFTKQYEREVKLAFQRMGSQLAIAARRQVNVVGKSTTFQQVGKGVATSKARHGTITPMNQLHTPVPCPLEDFHAGDWVDRLDELKLNIDERQVIANSGAFALGRKLDDLLLTALDGTSQTIITWTVTSAAAIRNALIEMVEALNANDVPDDGQRYAVLSPRAWAMALLVDQFSRSNYVGEDLPFKNRSNVRDWLGVKWQQHSGVPGVGTATAKVYAWHKTAVGAASGADVTTDITWHGDRAAHFVNSSLSFGACLIEDGGVIEGNLDDTASLPTS